MLPEVMQVLRGAGKVGSALVTTQGEQLRLMACTSSIGAGLKAAQDAVQGLVGTFMGSSEVRLWSTILQTEACHRIMDDAYTEEPCFPLLLPQEQSVKEDVFPDAEGWENVDPEEAAKWSVGSEFVHDPLEQPGIEHCRNIFKFVVNIGHIQTNKNDRNGKMTVKIPLIGNCMKEKKLDLKGEKKSRYLIKYMYFTDM